MRFADSQQQAYAQINQWNSNVFLTAINTIPIGRAENAAGAWIKKLFKKGIKGREETDSSKKAP